MPEPQIYSKIYHIRYFAPKTKQSQAVLETATTQAMLTSQESSSRTDELDSAESQPHSEREPKTGFVPFKGSMLVAEDAPGWKRCRAYSRSRRRHHSCPLK